MIFLQLGNYKFEGIKLPQSWSSNKETKYSEIPIINSKPILQKTGEALEELEFGISLSSQFCNPAKELSKLNYSRRVGEVLQLVDGKGVNYGKFVIKSISSVNETCLSDGTPIKINASIALTEYVGEVITDKKGIALKSNNPTIQIPKPQGITLAPEAMNKIKAGTLKSNFKIPLSPTQGMLNKIKKTTDDIWSDFGDAVTLIQKSEKLVRKTKNLVNSLKNAQVSSRTLSNYIVNGQIVKLAGAKTSLDTNIREVKRNSAILAAIIGSREGRI